MILRFCHKLVKNTLIYDFFQQLNINVVMNFSYYLNVIIDIKNYYTVYIYDILVLKDNFIINLSYF